MSELKYLYNDGYENKSMTIQSEHVGEVIAFINNFYNNVGDDADAKEVLRTQFRSGYCYYFAVMLKTAFRRGDVCWCAPFGHLCWRDIDGIPYDCEGIYTGEAEYLIPEEFLGDAIKDFLHNGEIFNATKEDLINIINDYISSGGEPWDCGIA